MTSAPPTVANTLVILPARDEAATLPAVLAALTALGFTHLRVVDNGSRDATAALARAAGAEVLTEPTAGYGRACLRALATPAPGCDWVLFCDADGSDDPADIPRLLAAGAQADFILGDRRATAAGRRCLTPPQAFGNWLSTRLIRLGWGHLYHDLGPLRLMRRVALDRLALRSPTYGWTLEMQVRAVEAGLRIRELPVNYRPRQGGRSKISGNLRGVLAAGTIILTTLGQLWFTRHRRAAPQPA